MRSEAECRDELWQEGYTEITVQTDPPGLMYPEHTHETTVAHVILEGEMTLVVDGRTNLLKAGDRFDAPAHAVHSARIGLEGCTYLIGERS